jgi:hypothetical protein
MSTSPNRAFRLARRARVLTQAQVAAMVAELVEQATGRRCGIDADYVSKSNEVKSTGRVRTTGPPSGRCSAPPQTLTWGSTVPTRARRR